MAFYADEDDVWKCPEHPLRKRNIGVCPTCLREKLSALCPECANTLPCNCCSTISASSSCSSSSLSFISIPGDAIFSGSAEAGSVGSIGRVSSLIDSEQSYQRSRSVALPFFKSARYSNAEEFVDPRESSASIEKSRPFWLYFLPRKSKREKVDLEEDEEADLNLRTIRRSKSVAAPTAFSCAGGVGEEGRSWKSKGWYFPSPMKVFRHSKASAKIVQERSPLHRG